MHLIEQLKSRFANGLPGEDAQYEMAPLGRTEFVNSVKIYRKAAVLSLLYPKKEEWHMVFIRRTSHEKDSHSAQISFPGGKMENGDDTMIITALREANEEINLNIELVKIIGDLTPLKIPISRFEVFPILAYSEEPLIFEPQISEVDHIIEIPISQIINSSNKLSGEVRTSSGIVLNNVPIFDYNGNIIWGATAMMLNEIIALLK